MPVFVKKAKVAPVWCLCARPASLRGNKANTVSPQCVVENSNTQHFILIITLLIITQLRRTRKAGQDNLLREKQTPALMTEGHLVGRAAAQLHLNIAPLSSLPQGRNFIVYTSFNAGLISSV